MPNAVPKTKAFDETIAFFREGYGFVSKRCSDLETDTFRTRIMLRKALCMKGAEAAELFYGAGLFTRSGAMPPTTLRLLQDKGSVQTLDGAAHRHRKAMFMTLMTPDEIGRLADLFERHFLKGAADWRKQGDIVFLDEIRKVLTGAVCDWAGIPVEEVGADEWARELSAMVEHAGSVGPGTLNALRLRRRTERRVRHIVEEVRSGKMRPPVGSALQLFAEWRDPDTHRRLDEKVVAVEIINVLRPVVAVSRFIVFAALALEEYPEWRAKLSSGDNSRLEGFVQEVRRFYPFFPVIGGRALRPFEWRGERFEKGQWVLLDLYGTNHDRRIWTDPQAFRPERFQDRDGSAFDFVPQGGGAFETAHRCPGEWATVALMKRAVRLLVSGLSYEVPAQDLTVSLSRMPSAPRSGFVMRNVRRV